MTRSGSSRAICVKAVFAAINQRVMRGLDPRIQSLDGWPVPGASPGAVMQASARALRLLRQAGSLDVAVLIAGRQVLMSKMPVTDIDIRLGFDRKTFCGHPEFGPHGTI